LEADVLKLRAFEMVLVLFYMEDLKRSIIGAINFTDKFNNKSRLDSKKMMQSAREVLVAEGVISPAESEELYLLLDYRNTIGHQLHNLTVDVGAYADLTDIDPRTYKPVPAYDYTAAKRAAALCERVAKGMSSRFILPVSFDRLKFEAAERTYLAEIKRLKKKVNNGIDQFNKMIGSTNAAIERIPSLVLDSAQPDHPRNTRENGTLSKHGASCIFQLYEANATPLAVAYLMRISSRSATSWLNKWKASKK
jgi:hypothetical protein